jgi:hypothetical protein
MKTFTLNGSVVNPSLTSASVTLLDLPASCSGFVVCNSDTTNSIFIHFNPAGAAAPTTAVVLKGIRVYPGTHQSIAIVDDSFMGCDVYMCTNIGTQTPNVYGVI